MGIRGKSGQKSRVDEVNRGQGGEFTAYIALNSSKSAQVEIFRFFYRNRYWKKL
jgi:hypothetical protein